MPSWPSHGSHRRTVTYQHVRCTSNSNQCKSHKKRKERKSDAVLFCYSSKCPYHVGVGCWTTHHAKSQTNRYTYSQASQENGTENGRKMQKQHPISDEIGDYWNSTLNIHRNHILVFRATNKNTHTHTHIQYSTIIS